MYNICDVVLFVVVQNDVYEFENKGSVYLIGDLNSRVGFRNNYIVCDSVNDHKDSDDYVPDVPLARASCNDHMDSDDYVPDVPLASDSCNDHMVSDDYFLPVLPLARASCNDHMDSD